jgi:hypothetical protein
LLKPCPGGAGDALSSGTPALILVDGATTGSAHVGDLIQVRLPTSLRWNYTGGIAALAPTAQAGEIDASRGICFWNFLAQSAGKGTIDFTGTALCEPMQPCAMFARDAHFTITIE